MRVLFTCRPLTGHFRPLLPLARAFAAAGHDVAFASGEEIARAAAVEGFRAFQAGLGVESRRRLDEARVAALHPKEIRTFFFSELFVRVELQPRAHDLNRIAAEWSPDLIVSEVAELAGPLVAARAGILHAGHGYGPPVQLDVLRAAGDAAASYWSSYGLAADPLAGVYAGPYLDVCPPSLQPSEPTGIGAAQPIRTVDVGPQAVARSIVYVTLGTIWNRDLDLFRTLLAGLADIGLDVIVTVGSQNDPAALGDQPANIEVHRYIPQEEVLPRCVAVVTHGGAGSTLGALAFGLPILLVPQGADQFYNAELVVAAGAGLQVETGTVTAAGVGAAMRSLLQDNCYRDAAERIRDEIAAMPDPAVAVAALEELVGAR